jgi:hypothetical protein
MQRCMQGNASTGTIAFAGMARSYRSTPSPTVIAAEVLQERPMAATATHARTRLDRNDRFRGHGPLLQVTPSPTVIAAKVL